MNKNQLINFITFSILESKRVEDRLFRNEIHLDSIEAQNILPLDKISI